VTGILYQCLVPRFADVDPETYNMDPESVESRVNDRTGAIVIVHHAGLPAELDALMAIAGRHHLAVVEDCAQAWYTHYRGRLCGTFGDLATFSLNHFKLITSGSGGMVLTDRDDLEALVKLFVDKCYFRDGRKRNPYFLAPNYQMTELQGAVARAQLDKIAGIVDRRRRLGMRLIRGLESIPGIAPQKVPEHTEHSFFLLVVRLDPQIIHTPLAEFCAALEAEGIPCEPGKITGGMPIYRYDIFQNRSAFPGSQFPFVSTDWKQDVSYPPGLCPRAEEAFQQTFNLNITEFYTESDIDEMVEAVAKVAEHYR
jgi:perosamine synthetase